MYRFFYQNSIVVGETMFTLKRRLLSRQRAQVPFELNKRIPRTLPYKI